ncbi:neutral zinc metallopeptidase [Sporichthya polymorpha]|uniref:neutral zinc metallopeptidase n=1 Tax=Sporichthya polymorpha TaxID=35751 RepID=UPI0012EBE970|nr:neutral zinc metallopeptidase [Sporichthya polymorpha]
MRIPGVVTAIAVPVAVLGLVGGVVLAAEGQFRSEKEMHSAAIAESDAATAQQQAPAPAAAAAPEAAAAQPAKAAAPTTNKPGVQTAPAKPATAGISLAEYAGYQRGIINTIDNWWVSALSRAGVRYSGPRLVVAAPGKSAMSKCGRAVANPADSKKAYPAFYCRGDKTVYLASGWMHGAIYARYNKGGVAAIVAHEFGHHIQHTIGIADPKVSKQELQADCLAGIWVRAAVGNGSLNAKDVADARRALRALGDTETSSKLHHGTANERSAWFDRGYRSGDAYVCNHF